MLVPPSGFEDSLDLQGTADQTETEILRVVPNATIVKAPLVDDGGLRGDIRNGKEGFNRKAHRFGHGPQAHHVTLWVSGW